ncbi:MAG: hypothetical protein ACXU89_21220 [Xanthobacteraceae bacterium]
MTIKAIGPSGLLLAAGLFVCLAGPSPAAAGAEDAAGATKPETAGKPVALHKYARHGSLHGKKYAHRGSGNVAQKATTGDKTADAADDGDHSSPMPASVANANAQLTPAQPTSADNPTSNAARAMTARASDILQAAPDKPADAPPPADTQSDAQSDTQVVSADQLNDVDRALRETPPAASTPPAAPLAVAPTEAPVAARSNESSPWDQTSLIGKIFIGFGAVLTMASAARMFMA